MGQDLRINAIILCGGEGKRFIPDKALLKINNETIIDRNIRILSAIFTDVILVTSRTNTYRRDKAKTYKDILPKAGPLGGIYTGLYYSSARYNLVVAGDMPFLNREVILYMKDLIAGYDIVVPVVGNEVEPLLAFFSRTCLPLIKRQILKGQNKIREIFSRLNVRYILEEEIKEIDPLLLTFFNINTPEEYQQAVNIYHHVYISGRPETAFEGDC